MFNPVQVGKRTRYSYARIKEVMEMPHLLDIQRKSYEWFLYGGGLEEILRDIEPITDFNGKLKLFFRSSVPGAPRFTIGKPKYTLDECKERDGTYSVPIRVNVQLVNENGEVKEQEVFMGDLPLMTETGTFVINGAERVIVSQLVRSPGAYYNETIDQTGKKLFGATVIPNRGAWIELETDASDSVSVRIDRTRKMPVTYLLRALDFWRDDQILELFEEDPFIVQALENDGALDGDPKFTPKEAALIEIYKRLRPGEPATPESAQQLLNSLFFDPKRYDLATVGRYKFTKKLGLRRRLLGKTLAEDIIDEETGEVLIPAGVVVTEEHLDNIPAEREAEIFGLIPDEAHRGYITPIKVKIKDEEGKVISMLCAPSLSIDENRTICIADIVSAISYMLNLMHGIGHTDDIDHLGNRRVRSVGELLQNQFRIGLTRMERVVRERMTIQEPEIITPQLLINIRPVVAAIKEFFGSSQLSQFMDQHNPLSELTHKRRLSALGPGGLSRERAGFEVRDVHNSHYGRMCPIETPEGPNIGLIGSLSNYARINKFGFMETPYRKVDHVHKKVTAEVKYLTADEEDVLTIAQANEPLDENDWFVNERVTARRKEETTMVRRDRVDYMDVSPKQVVSIATAMIPFLENDDANRALMGANMQRQAVPLLRTQAPLVGTGMEFKAACDSGVMVLAQKAGTVVNVDADTIKIKRDEGDTKVYKFPKVVTLHDGTQIKLLPSVKFAKSKKVDKGDPLNEPVNERNVRIDPTTVPELIVSSEHAGNVIATDSTSDPENVLVTVKAFDGGIDLYKLQKFVRSNQGTCINQIPIVDRGEHVEAGQPIADGPATDNGELALGYNILVAYMPWEGYNYEDAILLSENLIKRDIYTSIHIEEYQCDARDTKLGPEEVTRDIPNVSEDSLTQLDADGIIAVGADVRPGDILVGKVTPKGETELTAEERLLRAIFGEKAREVRDTSLRVPHGEAGKIVAVKIFTRENNDEMAPGVNKQVRVYIAQKRKISVGDKMSGRHGNKGVVSRIMREEDMPFLPDGTPIDIVLNPLGVPSRMNIGQVLETHLGMAVRKLGLEIKEGGNADLKKRLEEYGYNVNKYGIPKPDKAGVHVATPVFDGAREEDVIDTMKLAGLDADGKTVLYDGRTGEPFENRVTVGCVYMLKLHHLVDDKIHARSTGPYSLVTQQPLGGKAQFGGQRFGEMEVWALEAYGASYTLQEILTVKSDDVVGRVKAYEAIVKGQNIPEPGVPESFKVLIKELQSIGLDIKVLSGDSKEIIIRDDDEDDERTIRSRAENVGVDVGNYGNHEVQAPPEPEEPAEPEEEPETEDNDTELSDDEIIARIDSMEDMDDLAGIENDFSGIDRFDDTVDVSEDDFGGGLGFDNPDDEDNF